MRRLSKGWLIVLGTGICVLVIGSPARANTITYTINFQERGVVTGTGSITFQMAHSTSGSPNSALEGFFAQVGGAGSSDDLLKSEANVLKAAYLADEAAHLGSPSSTVKPSAQNTPSTYVPDYPAAPESITTSLTGIETTKGVATPTPAPEPTGLALIAQGILGLVLVKRYRMSLAARFRAIRFR